VTMGTQVSIPATMTDLEKARRDLRAVTARERAAEEILSASKAIARRDAATLREIRKEKRQAEDTQERLVAVLNREG
jgi:hypothetical protein